MNHFKKVLAVFCLSLAALAFSPGVKADDWDKKTIVTFSQPIEIPGGIILPAGTYVFKLMNSLSDRHIVQIFNEEQNHIYATILAIPNYRLKVTDKTVITFGESAVGVPQAIRAWFYPGANSGEEFVYPKKRAMELAMATNVPILAMPAELEAVITKPAKSETDEPIIALKKAPVIAVRPSGEEVEIAQVVTPLPSQPEQIAQTTPAPPASTTNAQETRDRNAQETRDRNDRLPQTASLVPLIALLGLISVGLGIALAFPQKTLSMLQPKA